MTVNYCLRHAKRDDGDKTAIDHEGQRLTYREFAGQVEESAAKLRGLGAEKGDRVAVLMLNSPAYLDLYFSTARSETLIVPLNTRWHVNDVIFALKDSSAKLLFIDDRFASLAADIQAACPDLKGIVFAGEGACPDGLIDWRTVSSSGPLPEDEPDEDDLVGLFYTSGTTGGPKGAMLTHRNVCSNAIHSLMPPAGFLTEGRWLHAAPMFHLADAGAIYTLTLCGVTHCFLGTFDPETLMRTIQRHRITNLVLVPTMINMVVNHPSFEQYDLSSLKRISYGASPMPLPLLKTAMEKFGCEFTQGYGMTETSPLLTWLTFADHRLEDTDRAFAPVKSAGRPLMGVEVRVVDDQDREVPVGQVGEVVARGPNVMKGYWKRPEVNAEVLRGGWMHTGDMGAFDEEGFLYILDRKKDMIKSGGENVYSPEVESMLCGHPDILEASVIGVHDPKWGETIRAIAVRRAGAAITEADLIGWSRERLTHFKCPSSVVFIEALPKGGTGKVQKNVLRERFGDSPAAGAQAAR